MGLGSSDNLASGDARLRLFDVLGGAVPIVFGCEQLGGFNWGDVDAGEVGRAIDYALEAGIIAFDTADCYGPYTSERRLGAALARQPLERRSKAVVCTKFGVRLDGQGRRTNDSSAAWCKEAVRASLTRLGTERIDLYQLHCHDGRTPLEETIGALQGLQDSGLIRAWGLCNVALKDVPVQSVTACSSLQGELSLLAAGRADDALMACGCGIQFLAYGVLGQGLLSGKYTSSSKFGEGDRRSLSRYQNFHGARFMASLELVAELNRCAAELGCSPAALAIGWVRSLHTRVWPIVGIKQQAQIDDALRGVALAIPIDIGARLREAAMRFWEDS